MTYSWKQKKMIADAEAQRPRPYLAPPVITPSHDDSNWLVSYADMMTLLCGFFIMMFALSTVDKPKFEVMKKELAKEFGGKYEKPTTEVLATFVTQVIQEAGVAKETSVKYDVSGVTIEFASTLFFDTLSAEVKPEGRAVLDKLIDAITSRKKPFQVVVEGHTDSRPVNSGPYPTNWELSGARAARVVRLFVERGFEPGKLTAIGYADTRPEFAEHRADGSWDEQALIKNRRVVLKVIAAEVTEQYGPPETSEPPGTNPDAGRS